MDPDPKSVGSAESPDSDDDLWLRQVASAPVLQVPRGRALAEGARLGPYEIIRSLGSGGMGEVYRARDTRLGRDVAVKVLATATMPTTDQLRRFELEARAVGALNHPNVLVLFDVGTHDGIPYVVSELLEGETLRQRQGGAALPLRKAIEYGLQI